MDDLLGPLSYWHWWIIGVGLIVAELLAPGIYLLWLGLAALVTGVIAWGVGFGWQGQVMVFAILSVASAVGGRMVYTRSAQPTDHPTLNRRAAQYIGQAFTLDQPIVNGSGRIKVADTTWKVVGPDCAAGAQVRVVGADGVVLKVEPAE